MSFLLIVPFGVFCGAAAAIGGGGRETSIFMLFAGFAIALAFTGPAMLAKHRVHERALVVGNTFPGARKYIIPWNTIDVERVRLHRRANFMGRRQGDVFERWGNRSIHHDRVGPMSTIAITLPGLDAQSASPKIRESRRPDGGTDTGSPFPMAIWTLGTQKPGRLLRAIGHAMVNAGRQDASGLTERVMANPVTERYRHPLTEEEIYGPGHGAQPRHSCGVGGQRGAAPPTRR